MVSPSPDLPKKKTKKKKKSISKSKEKMVASARFPRGRSAQDDFGFNSVSDAMNPKFHNSTIIGAHKTGGYTVKRLCHGSVFGDKN